MIRCVLIFCFCVIAYSINAQILSGPMLGSNTMYEVQIWVQTVDNAIVKAEFWPEGRKEERRSSEAVQTTFAKARTATLALRYLYPGTTYRYKIYVNDAPYPTGEKTLTFTTQPLWQYRTDPPAFTFLTGSCHHKNDSTSDRAGKPYGDRSKVIFRNMAQEEADFMLWLGDNVYLRTPDFDSRSGIYYRYTDFKSDPALQPLWQNMHHYACWDDHDYGPNNSDRSYLYKHLTREAFTDFWANPTYGQDNEGIYTAFRWADCDFFLLDNRYFRTPNDLKEEGRTALGATQLQWLKDQLLYSRATFKFIALGGQFLNPSAMYENMATYEEERKEILAFIQEYQIRNVIFLSGDRHRSELSKLSVDGIPTIYDLTCSPLSSGPHDERPPENNSYRVPGTKYADRNYASLSVEGPYKKRTLTIILHDKTGREIWRHVIPSRNE